MLPYDRSVEDASNERSSVRRRLRRVPGGLTATRVAVSRRGGLTAVAVAFGIWVLGLVLGGVAGAVAGDTAGGVARFALTLTAVPLMPAFGLPAAAGSTRVALSVVASAVLWFALGQWAARLTSRRILSGWREWTAEVAPLALGVGVGAVTSLLLAALVLGVL